MEKKNGFTLIELLAVVAVLAVLVIFIVPKAIASFENARKETFLTDSKTILKSVQTAILQTYYNNDVLKEEYDSQYDPLDIKTELDYRITLEDKTITSLWVSNGKYEIYISAFTSAKDLKIESVEKSTISRIPQRVYTVAYNCNGGSGITPNSSHKFYEYEPLSTNNCIYNGGDYTLNFLGWSTDSGATSPTYTNGQQVKDLTDVIGATVTLYAVWSPTYTYTVAYNCNGGTGSIASTTHRYNYAKNLSLNTCYKITTGSAGNVGVFKGWSTNSGATTPTYVDGQSVTNLSGTGGVTVTLYAVWQNLFTYSGSYELLADPAGSSNWRLRILSGASTSLVISNPVNIEAFLVGGGGGGAQNYNWVGGGGGGGGRTTYVNSISLTAKTYYLTVGAGGAVATSGSASSFVESGGFSYSASGGTGSTVQAGQNGGSGGGAGGHNGSPSTGGNGGSYGGNGSNNARGNSAGGTGQYASTSFTTCEFNQGTISGCNAGVTAYGGGGGGGGGMSSSVAGASGSAGAGCGSTNTGCGGRGGVGGTGGAQTGVAGIIVIRNKR